MKKSNMYSLRVLCYSFLLVLIISLTRLPIVSFAESKLNRYENIALGKSYTLQPKPNYPLCQNSDDYRELTDGVYTQGYFWAQKTTVGWKNVLPIIITIDLKKPEPIRGLSYNTAGGASDVTWPASINILVSDDGENYNFVGDLVSLSKKNGVPPTQKYSIHRYWTDDLKTHGRFIQLVVDPGGFYCFADEIEIYRGNTEWMKMQVSGEKTLGGTDYFRQHATDFGIHKRLKIDIQETEEAINSSGLMSKSTDPLIQELAELEKQIDELNPVNPTNFQAIMPMNNLEARIFAIRGNLRALKGTPSLQAWTCHPYDFITPTQVPDEDAKKQIMIPMMRNEWRYAVVNLTNSSDKPIVTHLYIKGMPGGANPNYISVYQVEWTDTKEYKPIAAALIEKKLDGNSYTITVPAGMVRQVWFSLHPVHISPGNYQGNILITRTGEKDLSVPMTLQLFPLDFPTQPTLHLGGFDYTDRIANGVTKTNRDTLITFLQDHFVDSPWGTSLTLGMGKFDEAGNMANPSTRSFDEWVEHWPKARRYCIYVNGGESLANAKIGTPEFNMRVKSWIDFWVSHARQKGIQPNQLVLLILDEPGNKQQENIINEWVKAIHAAQPKVLLWEDPIFERPQDEPNNMFSTLDILCLNRTLLNKKNSDKDFLNFYNNQQTQGRHLDLYSCEGPMNLLDPYSYVRLQAWTAWNLRAESSYFWSFSDTGGGNLWQPYTTIRNNYSPMFLAPDSITSAKHMEAMRESVEDYEYFIMLQNALNKVIPKNTSSSAISRAKELLSKGALEVLNEKDANNFSWLEPKDHWKADNVRLQILNTIMDLNKKTVPDKKEVKKRKKHRFPFL